jgi:predicted transcriptional regulator
MKLPGLRFYEAARYHLQQWHKRGHIAKECYKRIRDEKQKEKTVSNGISEAILPKNVIRELEMKNKKRKQSAPNIKDEIDNLLSPILKTEIQDSNTT